MNLAKKYYVDTDGDMIRNIGYHGGEKIKMPAEPFHAKLRIVGIHWLRKGVYLKLQDENGKAYYMNDVMFKEFIGQNEVFLESDWNFCQQGTVFSIG